MPEALTTLQNERKALQERLERLEKAERLAAEMNELYAADQGLFGLVVGSLPQPPRPADARKR